MPSSLIPCTDRPYLSPVKIIEETFVNPLVVNGTPEDILVTAEQLTFIVFMALTVEVFIKKTPVPRKGVVTDEAKKDEKFDIEVLASVNFAKLIVFAANPIKPTAPTDEILNEGIDSKE